MATKSMAYDHPQYMVAQSSVHSAPAGANAVAAGKFLAFTNLIIKSATAAVITAGTSAGGGNGVIVKAITGQGTTTTALGTISLNTQTSGVSANVVLSSGTSTLLQGEYLTFTNGTDATGASIVSIEYVPVPGATVTV